MTDNHVKDLTPSKLEGGKLDEKYVISSRIRTGRNVRGYALSPFVCRSERRQVEKIAEQGGYICFTRCHKRYSQK